ncbi:roundabout homolog 1-like isoform X2 [Sparus aurata]|uniref:roundabout homolog 1-like isoform X2 n=1 Tax=Sparus aurata TaxID=8175 RepID=UPI0011C1B797|nr:roundabout homolog 1-like isoform X2 [Sparus aurata]
MELLPLVCLCLLSCSGDARVRVVVEQDSDAVLPCSPNPKVDLTGQVFDWKKDGQKEVFFYDSGIHSNKGHTGQDKQFWERVEHFQDQLKNGDASIKINNTKMADNGIYSCIFPRLQSQTFDIELVVGAAPEPYIKILAETKHWRLLQCEAHGDPLPTVEWKDSDNNTLPAEKPHISERGGRSYVTVKITVTKTDNYSCVATQETLSHQVAANTSVLLAGAASEPSVTIVRTDEGKVLQCKVLGASPKPKVEWKDSSGNVLPVKDLKETESGDIVLQAAVTKTDNFRCVVFQEGSDSPLSAQIHADVPGLSAAVIAAIVVPSLLFVGSVVAGVLAVLYLKNRIKQIRTTDEEKREPQTEPNSSTSLRESS